MLNGRRSGITWSLKSGREGLSVVGFAIEDRSAAGEASGARQPQRRPRLVNNHGKPPRGSAALVKRRHSKAAACHGPAGHRRGGAHGLLPTGLHLRADAGAGAHGAPLTAAQVGRETGPAVEPAFIF
jgi:hypothetical protein